jgi:hypothetical protein
VLARTCLLAALLAGSPALAQSPAPGGIPDLAGPRALGLSAGIGVAAGNEGLFLNPAATAARRRYSVEGGALVDRRGAETTGRYLGVSVVDSLSSALAGGVSYVRAQEGLHEGNVWHVALAGPLAEDVYLGVTGKYLDVEPTVDGLRSSRAVTVDAGLFWQAGPWVSFGAAGYNLVPISNEVVAPMGAGAGFGIGRDTSFQVTADWRGDFDRAEGTTNRWAAGAEVLLGGVVPVRAGWMKDETLDGDWWSVGAGIISRGGVALDVGYRQGIDDSDARTVAATLKLFLFR